MYSEQFTVDVHGKQTRWRLKMYPNGRKNVDQGYVTLFLKDSGRNQPANIRANVKFSVIDSVGDKKNTKTIDKEYKVLNHAFGYSKFIKHQDLLSPEKMLLPDDKLTLMCSITFAGKSIISSGAHRPTFQKTDPTGSRGLVKLGEDMGNLLDCSRDMFSDLKLLCGERKVELSCHTNVLAARSKVFLAMFTHDTVEAQNKVVVMPDLEPEVAEDMLHYIYTGVLKTNGKEADLLAAADKYSLLELKVICEEALCNETNIDTVLKLLVLADRHEASKLKDVCAKFLIENSHTIVKQPEWRNVLEPYPCLLAEMFEALATTPPTKRRRVE